LKKDLGLSVEAISLGLRNSEQNPRFLAIALWQYGLVTLDQLSLIFDWLEQA
jgi:hypothetical protein